MKIRKNKKRERQYTLKINALKLERLLSREEKQLTGQTYKNRSFDCFFVIRFENLPTIAYSRHGVASNV